MKLNQDTVPPTFFDACELLVRSMELREIAELREGFPSTPLAVAAACSWFGSFLRNAWSLWSMPPTPLREDMRRWTGLMHPDDVVTLVIAAAVATVRGDVFDLDEAARTFRAHRADLGCLPDGTFLRLNP